MLVILNPTSGRGHGERDREAILRALKGAGLRFDLVQTEEPGHAIALARVARQQGYTTVVAAGGDGTVSEVVNGLMLAHVQMEGMVEGPPAGRLGVIPVGSGNDFATMVGIPRKFDQAAEQLLHGRTRLVDVGHATIYTRDAAEDALPTLRFFDNNMGIGLEAAVIFESSKIRRLRGALLYGTAAIRTLIKHKSPHMHIHWESSDGESGEQDRRTLLVSVGNSPRAGGGFYLTPDAKVDDKYLDVAIAKDVSRPAVLALLPRALVGKHTTHPAVTMLRVQRLRVSVPDGAPVQMDGELMTQTASRIEIDVLPRRLEVIAQV